MTRFLQWNIKYILKNVHAAPEVYSHQGLVHIARYTVLNFKSQKTYKSIKGMVHNSSQLKVKLTLLITVCFYCMEQYRQFRRKKLINVCGDRNI